jgi:hypothetical protein
MSLVQDLKVRVSSLKAQLSEKQKTVGKELQCNSKITTF